MRKLVITNSLLLGLFGIMLFAVPTATESQVITCDGIPATHVGTDNHNVIIGSNGDDVIVGFDGPDQIFGRRGNDLICGDGGGDSISGDAGNDILLGGAGSASDSPP
jgi:Ca2+-binding RTX toxin-like protein